MKRWLAAIPVAALLGFGTLAAVQLMNPEKNTFERVSRLAPDTEFPTLKGSEITFRPPPEGQSVAVNLFASWCAPCEAEHKYIQALSEDRPGQVFGVLYKDTPENGAAFLEELGNPYTKIALDPGGQGGLDFGLTGVPETFVISSEGEIVLHIAGPLDESSVKKVSEALESASPH